MEDSESDVRLHRADLDDQIDQPRDLLVLAAQRVQAQQEPPRLIRVGAQPLARLGLLSIGRRRLAAVEAADVFRFHTFTPYRRSIAATYASSAAV